MSTLGGLNFGIRISAQDDTRGGLNSVLSNISSLARTAVKPITIPLQIARGGLGLLRDLQMGLRPTVEMLDRFITRGSGLEAVQRAFTAQTGQGARRAEFFARTLQAATFNTLRWADAMKLANRGLSDGIGTDKLNSIFRFATVKAAAIGESTEGVLGGLLRGLGMGSGRVLKEFGLDLGDVEERYARIKGVGAFDDLPFAERRMVILAAATEKMAEETAKLKLTGRESGFVWQGIKTQIGDAVDKLTLAVVKSDAMRGALGGIGDVLGGMTRHFEQGGTFGQLFFGKGKSGGLFGLAGGALKDLGAMMWSGLKAAFDKVFGYVKEKFYTIFDSLKRRLFALWDEFKPRLLTFFDELPTKAVAIGAAVVTGIKQGLSGLGAALPEPVRNFFRMDKFQTDHSGERWVTTQPATTQPATTQPAGAARSFRPKSWAQWKSLGAHLLDANLGRLLRLYQMEFTDDWNREIGGVFPGQEIDKRSGYPITRGPAMNPLLFVGRAAMSGALAQAVQQPGHFAQALAAFGEDFPSGMPGNVARAGVLMDPSRYRMTLGARMSAKGNLSAMKHRLRNIERGGEFARRDSRLAAAAEISSLRKQGLYLSGSDIREIYDKHLRAEIDARAKPLRGQISAAEGDLERDDATRKVNREIKRLTTVGKRDHELDEHIANRIRERYLDGDLAVGPDSKKGLAAEAAASTTAKNTGDIRSELILLRQAVMSLPAMLGVGAAEMPRK